jgi:hypothetical protein
MRAFAIAADVVMGLILGVFLYAALSAMWETLERPFVAVVLLAAGVLVALFRRPGGSLAPRDGRSSGR